MDQKVVYLDHQASTPVDPLVFQEMLPYFCEKFGNPHALQHIYGNQAFEAIEHARRLIADTINAEPSEIFFTSGATESNNLAIRGIISNLEPLKTRLITCATEHQSVFKLCKQLCSEGYYLTLVNVNQDGLINFDELEKSIDLNTSLISIMGVNSEIGTIQPLERIGEICKKKNTILHSDLAQSIGRVNIDVKRLNIAMASISAHKNNGPKGIGALYVSKSLIPNLHPLLFGGNQERNIRPGTLSTPLCVGFGKACELAIERLETNNVYIKQLRECFLEILFDKTNGLIINGSMEQRIMANINLQIKDIDANLLIEKLPEIAISSGSACSSVEMKPSHVLMALGLNSEEASSSIRISFGKTNTLEEIKYAATLLVEQINKMRQIL